MAHFDKSFSEVPREADTCTSHKSICQEDCGCVRLEPRDAAEVEGQKEVGSLAATGREQPFVRRLRCMSLGGQPSGEPAGQEGDFKDCIGLDVACPMHYLSTARRRRQTLLKSACHSAFGWHAQSRDIREIKRGSPN